MCILCTHTDLIFQLPEVEVKDHPDDIRSFELHNPATPNYPITLVAHKDPVKACWLKEIRQYTSDLVALAEHAADDLQLTEVSESKEEIKSEEKSVSVKIESPQEKSRLPKVEEDNKQKEEISTEASKEIINLKSAEETDVKPNPLRTNSTKESTKVVEKRKDIEDTSVTSEVKKTKVEDTPADMSRRYSASRYSASKVEGKL